MPRTASGYSGVAALVSDQAMLATLDSDQYSALVDYLVRCNILLVHQPPPGILPSLKLMAGCGGRFVEGFSELSRLPRLLTSLHQHRPAAGPPADELARLVQPAQTANRSRALVFLALAYLLLIALIAYRNGAVKWLVLLPVLTSVTMLLAWRGEGRPQSLSWAETWNQDEMMRVSRLVVLGQHRRGSHGHCFADDAMIRAGEDVQRVARYEYLPASRQYCVRQFAALLSGVQFQLEQVAPSPGLVRLEIDPAGLPLASAAHNNTTLSGARLLWQNRVHAVPPLAPSTSWKPLRGQGSTPTSPEEQLLQRRLPDGQAALLMPLTGATGSGWLVVHPDPGALR